jgi:hypothetical protein
MNRLTIVALALACAAPAVAMQAARNAPTEAGRITLYEAKNYSGDSYEIDSERRTLRTGWNTNSVAIHPGDRWQLCNRARFQEPCITLDRSIADMSALGAAGDIGSVRPMPKQ